MLVRLRLAMKCGHLRIIVKDINLLAIHEVVKMLLPGVLSGDVLECKDAHAGRISVVTFRAVVLRYHLPFTEFENLIPGCPHNTTLLKWLRPS